MKIKLSKKWINFKVLVGIVCFVMLVALWFGLPFIGLTSVTLRICVFVGIFLTTGLIYSVKLYLAWRSSGQFFRALSQQVTDEHQLEVAALQEKMKEAVEKLRASGLHAGYRGAAALYALPWYMIIGPSAAGKSTLLRHSNLHFPYSANDKIDIKGFAGTRNCDWWFADEAIILDTAGRYTLEETDKPEWLAFLKILRRFRPRAPINGVIVTISLEELLSSDKDGLTHHTQIIRQKLDELNKELGIVIPVNLVITKCDKIEGFTYFFKDLSAELRDQAWGVKFSGQDYQAGLEYLINKLCDWRLHKLALSPALEHKHAIMAFPHEFEEAVKTVAVLLENLTRSHHYQEQPLFKGVYFTSSLQEETTQAQTSPKSFFVKDLFRKIIFQQKTTTKNARQKSLTKRLKFASAIFAVLSCLTVATLLEQGHRTQRELYAKQEVLLKDLERRTSYDQLAGVLKIYQLMSSIQMLENEDQWRFLLGYNTPKRQVRHLEKLYLTYFIPLMAEPAYHALEQNIHTQTKTWPGMKADQQAQAYADFYDQLKAYLMLGNLNRLDSDFVGEELNQAWTKYLNVNQAEVPLILSPNATRLMFQAYAELLKKGQVLQTLPTINPSLVQNARDELYLPPDAKLLYQHLVSRAQQELGHISLQEILEGQDQGMIVNRYPMPKMYTKQAFEKSVLPMMRSIVENAGTGDWVLQEAQAKSMDRKSQEKWIHELRAIYFQEYIQHWMRWLGALEVKHFNSLDDASSKLLKLQREGGPLMSVIEHFDDNLNWYAPELAPAKQAIAELTNKENLKQYFSQLAVIQTELATLSASTDPHRDAESYARKVISETSQTSLATAMNTVHGLVELGPEAKSSVTAFLRSPIDQSWRTILNAAGTHIQGLWEAEVVALYNQSLRGKFPFAKTQTEVAVDDVTNFFNPRDGVMNQFIISTLKPYLKQGKGGLSEHQWMGQGIGFSSSFLAALSQAEQITQGLFKPGSADPKFTFYLQPVAVPGLEEVIFDSNGQEYRYRNEPEEWRRFTWPGEAAEIGARLSASTRQSKQAAELEYQGLWGLFHLMSDAKMIRQGGTQYLSSWKLKDRSGQVLEVKFRMKADKASHVLDPKVLTQFKLPEVIKTEGSSRG